VAISFAKITYSSTNLGDDIQTLATLPFLGDQPVAVDREELATYVSNKKMILLMNGWWAHEPAKAFPPADCFEPIFIGFHIAKRHEDYFLQPHCLSYFKKYQPIGCRDEYTSRILREHGVESFFSGCLSTTFDQRVLQEKPTKIFLVDTKLVDHLIPERIKHHAIKLTHVFHGTKEERENALQKLMTAYRDEARLVITTRLHAALLCSALGVPVVFFFDKQDPRASTATQVSLTMYDAIPFAPGWLKKLLVRSGTKQLWGIYHRIVSGLEYKFFKKIDWDPEPRDLEEHKRRLKNQTLSLIAERLKAL
jgi:hypothetical protein